MGIFCIKTRKEYIFVSFKIEECYKWQKHDNSNKIIVQKISFFMLLKMSTCAALSFMSTKGNQEGHKSDSIKYVKMNALWHYFSTMHAYTSD